jgi:hypothetical protein
MTSIDGRVLLWIPRILGIAVALFVGMFALDAFSEGRPFVQALGDFLVHLLPCALLLGLVAASWHRPWIGALAFAGLAVLYALAVGSQRIDWTVAISGPLMIVGALYFWSWLRTTHQHG